MANISAYKQLADKITKNKLARAFVTSMHVSTSSKNSLFNQFNQMYATAMARQTTRRICQLPVIPSLHKLDGNWVNIRYWARPMASQHILARLASLLNVAIDICHAMGSYIGNNHHGNNNHDNNNHADNNHDNNCNSLALHSSDFGGLWLLFGRGASRHVIVSEHL